MMKNHYLTTRKVAFSQLARCLTDGSLVMLRGHPVRRAVVETPCGHDLRKIVDVEIGNEGFLADKITGSLYSYANGRCLTSTSMRLLLDTLGLPADVLRQRYPALVVTRPKDPKAKPGPKPKGSTSEEPY